ncbi:sensor histidine kinase [Halosimplex sp. J119]
MTDCDDGRPTATDGSDLVGAAFDALPAQVAVVDADGVIRKTNRAWRRFGLDNGLRGDSGMIGEDYLAVCDADDDETASEAAAGIRSVLGGERGEFTLEYPCHSPDERRWFLMRAITLSECEEPHALVMHVDITDRKETELRVAANNETLSTVASVLSHDLRNPLNVAMGRAERLADDSDIDPATVAEQIVPIRSALDRMNAIVDDALVLASGSRGVDPERVDLGTAARDAWSHVETDGLTLDIVDSEGVVADPGLLAQLFENLFRNAVDHADGAETVAVGTVPGGFYVADDGAGIAPEDAQHIFETGYSTGTSDDNTGMGLAIVQKVALAHGWEVGLADSSDRAAGDQSGTRFEVSGVGAAQ